MCALNSDSSLLLYSGSPKANSSGELVNELNVHSAEIFCILICILQTTGCNIKHACKTNVRILRVNAKHPQKTGAVSMDLLEFNTDTYCALEKICGEYQICRALYAGSLLLTG